MTMRRPQFSLKTLLWLMATSCVLVAIWREIVRTQLRIENRPGDGTVAVGRCFQWRGGPHTGIHLAVIHTPPTGMPYCREENHHFVDGKSPGIYQFEIKLKPFTDPGRYDVRLIAVEDDVIWAGVGDLSLPPCRDIMLIWPVLQERRRRGG
jgi:hypothetical protein